MYHSSKPKAAVSFTGGKDSMLALHEMSTEYDIVILVSFGPAKVKLPEKTYKAHPLLVGGSSSSSGGDGEGRGGAD